MPMPKMTLALTAPQLEFLKREASRLGLSVADVIRRIVDEHRKGKLF